MGIKLLALDWDQTVVEKHMNVFCCDIVQYHTDSARLYRYGTPARHQLNEPLLPHLYNEKWDFEDVASHYLQNHPMNKSVEIKHLIETAAAKGIKIAITTFSKFPTVIYHILKKIGVSEEILSEHMIISCAGMNTTDPSKNLHLELEMKYFGVKDKNDVLYADDDRKLIMKAKESGYNTIHAQEGQIWIEEAQSKIDSAEVVDGALPGLSITEICAINLDTYQMWNAGDPIQTQGCSKHEDTSSHPLLEAAAHSSGPSESPLVSRASCPTFTLAPASEFKLNRTKKSLSAPALKVAPPSESALEKTEVPSANTEIPGIDTLMLMTTMGDTQMNGNMDCSLETS